MLMLIYDHTYSKDELNKIERKINNIFECSKCYYTPEILTNNSGLNTELISWLLASQYENFISNCKCAQFRFHVVNIVQHISRADMKKAKAICMWQATLFVKFTIFFYCFLKYFINIIYCTHNTPISAFLQTFLNTRMYAQEDPR